MISYSDMFTELVRVEIELWNGLDAQLEAEVGLSLSTFQALAAVRASGGSARVQDLSTEMSITVGATSKLVDRLERDGLALRSPHPSDRRSSIVALSERGLTALSAADEAAETHLQDALAGALPADQAELLLTQLAALRTRSRVAARA